MKLLWLKITLVRDTTFGRGDGVAGLVDDEVQHDEYGLPYLSGKTLKGLLGAECAEILHALKKIYKRKQREEALEKWYHAASFLFGNPGSDMTSSAMMVVGDARLPQDLCDRVAWQFQQYKEDDEPGRAMLRQELLDSLTTLRRQTAMDAMTGAPQKETLRAMRVIRRDTIFESQLQFIETFDDSEDATLGLLAACVKSLRRAGTGRNRGRGRISLELFEKRPSESDATTGDLPQPITTAYFDKFVQEVSR